MHALEHACLLWFGLLLWLALLGPLPKPAWFHGWAPVGYVAAIRLIGAVLGNAMIWAQTLFYPVYKTSDAARGLNPLSDQNLAGAAMMIEQMFLTIVLVGWLFLRFARQDEERQGLLDLAAGHGVALSDERAVRAVNAGAGELLRERLLAQSPTAEPGPERTGGGELSDEPVWARTRKGVNESLIVSAFHHSLSTQAQVLVLAFVVVAVLLVVGRLILALLADPARRGDIGCGATRHPSRPPHAATPPMQRAPEPLARRVLRIGFGVLWLLDGALQIQSHMPLGLPENVVAPSAQGSPAWLVSTVHWGLRVWENHPVQAAVAAVWIQLGLGLWLLLVVRGRWSRLGGAVSIGWALSVWVFGESMGGILAPGASWLFGAPGAVLFYALAGGLLALPERAWRNPRLGRRLLVGFGVYFIAMAVLQAWPGNGFWTVGSSGALPAMASGNVRNATAARDRAGGGPLRQLRRRTRRARQRVRGGSPRRDRPRPAQRPPPRGAGGGGGGARGEPRRLGAGAGLRGVRRRRHRPQQHDPHAARAVGLLPRARASRARYRARARPDHRRSHQRYRQR